MSAGALPRSDVSRIEVPDPRVDVEFWPLRAPGYAAVVSLRGEHDLGTSAAIADALSPLDGYVLVDLSECDYIDSTVVGVILAKLHDLMLQGHALELVIPPDRENVLRIIEIVGLRALVTVHDGMPFGGAGESGGQAVA
jgi:anti-anti-sigma factor